MSMDSDQFHANSSNHEWQDSQPRVHKVQKVISATEQIQIISDLKQSQMGRHGYRCSLAKIFLDREDRSYPYAYGTVSQSVFEFLKDKKGIKN